MIKRKFRIVLVILWMAFIFYMSAQPADISSEMSLTVGKAIGAVIVPRFSSMQAGRQELFAMSIEIFVRKGAHALEYAVLSVLILRAFSWHAAADADEMARGKVSGILLRRWMKLSFALTVFYAATDEFHQLFVPGRSGMLRDVMIDAAGAAFGIACWCLAVKIQARYHQN